MSATHPVGTPPNPAARLLVALNPTAQTRKAAATMVATFAAELGDVDLLDAVADAVEGHPNAVTATELAKRTGLSYRQVDTWTAAGLLHPVQEADGSGTRRLYDPREVIRTRVMGSLVSVLGVRPSIASKIATDLLVEGTSVVEGFEIKGGRP